MTLKILKFADCFIYFIKNYYFMKKIISAVGLAALLSACCSSNDDCLSISDGGYCVTLQSEPMLQTNPV